MQPTLRFGVEVVGLLRLLPETAGPVGKQDCDPLSPATWRGFFCVPRALCNQPWYCIGGFAVVAAASPLYGTLAPLRRGFFVRRVSGRNENPSRVVLQPDVGHGLFQGRREPNARDVTRISPLRCATDCVVLSRWVCRYSHLGKPPLEDSLSPAILWRGFFCGRALCNDGAGLSANLLGVAHNLSDGRCWPGKPTLPPP